MHNSNIKLIKPKGSRSSRFGMLLVSPAHIMLVFIVVFPTVASIYLSLTTWSPLTGYGTKWFEAYKFWGWFSNYGEILSDPEFFLALARTLIIVLVAVPLEFALGLFLAFLFLDNFPGKRVFHTILLMPMMIVPAVVGFIFYMLFQSNGPVNAVLSGLLFNEISIAWLSDGVLAIISIIIADIWEWTPLMYLILLSGLMSLPEDQIDAAIMLGASRYQRFRLIILPLLKPVIFIALIIRAMEALKIFDVIWLMTTGGPGTATESISVYMYRHGFKYLNWSWVAAAGVLILVTISIASVYALKHFEKSNKQETVR
jgi:multiple sugar transport system permease protein